MNELLRLIAGPLAFTLEPGRFRFVNSSTGRSFGDARITLESAVLRLDLVRDRSQVSARLQPTVGPSDDWFWIGVFRRVLDGDRPGSDELDAGGVDFLRRWLDVLEERAATDAGRSELVEDLIRARAERAEELFG